MLESNNTVDCKHKRQVDMHRDFFIRAENAISNRFYLEAIFLEYAAIEGRLEVILGILGMPCNKMLDSTIRRKIGIADRVECLRFCYCNNPLVFEKSKINYQFFSKKGPLNKWIIDRNAFIHGLYKNVDLYEQRTINECKRLSKDGLEYSRLLYNEAKRLNRILKNHPEQLINLTAMCRNKSCTAYMKCGRQEEAATHV